MAVPKSKIINELLLYDDPAHWKFQENQWAFFVHASIIEQLQQVWHKFFTNSARNILEYTLKIGDECYDMRTIYVTLNYAEEIDTLREIIKNSQFSFPWHENPNLFINVTSYKLLQDFISSNDIAAHMLKVEELPGITAGGENIKLVTFSKSVSALNITARYENYLSSIRAYQPPQYYYLAFGFPWLQPRLQEYFKISVADSYQLLLEIVLKHLKSLTYNNELNIFDWLNFRLALYDYPLKHQIDDIIKQKLGDVTKNHHLDLERYALDTNCVPRDLLINYLVYEFQDNFETVTARPRETFRPGLGPDKPKSIIELAYERDVFTKLAKNRDITYYINGHHYDRMRFSLFMNLAEYDNVHAIYLDTNFRWINDVCDPNRSISPLGGRIYIFLVGENTHKFIENFVSSLKTMPFTMKTFSLHIHCNLDDYQIFDDLTVYRIDFIDMKIDKHMLDGLHKCNLKTMVRFYNCTFESTCVNWVLLDSIKTLNYVEIHEDKSTWQSIFEFILEDLHKSNSTEFEFKRKTIIVRGGGKRICLDGVKFLVDNENLKLEIYNTNTRNKQIIDLNDVKLGVLTDDVIDNSCFQ